MLGLGVKVRCYLVLPGTNVGNVLLLVVHRMVGRWVFRLSMSVLIVLVDKLFVVFFAVEVKNSIKVELALSDDTLGLMLVKDSVITVAKFSVTVVFEAFVTVDTSHDSSLLSDFSRIKD